MPATRSVALDPACALRPDAPSCRRLAATAQIPVESFRPGVGRWACRPTRCTPLNPRLIIVRISGWARMVAYRYKPGFGTLIES